MPTRFQSLREVLWGEEECEVHMNLLAVLLLRALLPQYKI